MVKDGKRKVKACNSTLIDCNLWSVGLWGFAYMFKRQTTVLNLRVARNHRKRDAKVVAFQESSALLRSCLGFLLHVLWQEPEGMTCLPRYRKGRRRKKWRWRSSRRNTKEKSGNTMKHPMIQQNISSKSSTSNHLSLSTPRSSCPSESFLGYPASNSWGIAVRSCLLLSVLSRWDPIINPLDTHVHSP